MSRSLGAVLPATLLTRLSQTDLPSRLGCGLSFVTLAGDGTLHPMLCSYLEWLAVDARTLRLAIAAGSRSARNLEERGVGTLLVVEPGQTIYIKCRAMGAPLRLGELARFSLTVEDVLEDAPTAEEGNARITGAITYAPVPGLDEPWVKGVLSALRVS
jgi:hypothetical protein